MSAESPHEPAKTRLTASAVLVATGMLFSRLSGYLRVTLFSHFFGLGLEADAFNAALRIPNFLQNLLGEGVLSASLIPVYSSLLINERAKADQVARAVAGLLAIISSALVVLGVTFAPQLVRIIGPGYHGEIRDLTIHLVRIMFPGIGLLVLSAWCLAILNSHHRFFLSYVAPVCWNFVIIVTLVIYRDADLSRLAVFLAWGALIGSALQLLVQVPSVWGLMARHWTPRGGEVRPLVRRVLVTSVPVVFTRGVVQVSAVIDSMIATLLPTGAVSALANAQQLYQLPVALFGMAVSSASLPSMSTAAAANLTDALTSRLKAGQETVSALVVPSVVAFLAFGDVMVALLLEHGNFTHDDTLYVWGILAGSAVGLLATTIGRLYVSTFYALGDTRTPTRIAVLRVLIVAGLGYVLAIPIPRLTGIPAHWGAAGLTISAGLAGWVEFALLRRALRERLGPVTMPARLVWQAWLIAAIAALPASALRFLLPVDQVIVRGVVILGAYGTAYLAGAHFSGLLPASLLIKRLRRR